MELPDEILLEITQYLDPASKIITRYTFFKEKIPENLDPYIQAAIAQHSLSFLFFCSSIRRLDEGWILGAATRHHNMEILGWANTRLKFFASLHDIAAIHGHLDIMQWLYHTVKVSPIETTYFAAIDFMRPEIVAWLFEMCVPYGHLVEEIAIIKGFEKQFNDHRELINKCRVFVSNLSPNTRDEDLKAFFPKAMKIKRTIDAMCYHFYCTAFIFFGNLEQAQAALNKNGEELLEYKIKVGS